MDTSMGDMTIANFTQTHIGMLMEEEPGLSASLPLLEDFMSGCVECTSSHQTLQLVDHFEQLCDAHAQLMTRLMRRAPPSKNDSTFAVLRQIESERNTWKLMRMLFEDRMNPPEWKVDEEMCGIVSDKQVLEMMKVRDTEMREMDIIQQWCHENSLHNLDSLPSLVNAVTSKRCLLDNTLHEANKSGKMTFSLDPDANIRGDKVDTYDIQDENELLSVIFQLVRCGKLDSAVELCLQAGEGWRAASLQAFQLHDDPNMGVSGQLTHVQTPHGNKARDQARAMCFAILQQNGVTSVEKAIYGAVSGHVSCVVPHCTTWEDYLWAYCSATINSRLDIQLTHLHRRTKLMPLPPSQDHVRDYNMQELIREVDTYVKTRSAYVSVQKGVMMNNADDIVIKMHSWLSKEQLEGSHLHSLRFMAHVLIVLTRLGRHMDAELSTKIMETYIAQLVSEGHTSLIAFYTSMLPPNRQIHVYANFCADIIEPSLRSEALELAENADLDLVAICTTVVSTLLDRLRNNRGDVGEFDQQPPTFPLTEIRLTKDDEETVNHLQWVLSVPSLRLTAVQFANAFVRHLILGGRSVVAYALIHRMPADILQCPQETNEDYDVMRQFICLKTYVDCLDEFGRWSQWIDAKPNALPDEDVKNMTFTQKAVYDNKVNISTSLEEKWKLQKESIARSLLKKIMTILEFPEANWLTNLHEGGEGHLEMHSLTKYVIPQITLMLVKVRQNHHQFKQAIQVTDLVASQHRKLYQYFDERQKKNLLCRISECSLVAQRNDKNHLGY